jgi:Carboxypeptidase regulatory-like domain
MVTTLLALTLALVSAASPPAVPLPPGELRGQVLGKTGAPVTRFTVNGVAFDGAEGKFKVLTPPQGEFRVVIRADGYAPNVFHVQGASGKKLQVPEIRLGDGEHVLGEVLDAETELPVADARVGLADPAKLERLRFVRPERVAPVAKAGIGGWYELRHAPRGLLVLVVSAPGYLPEFVPVNTREPLPTVFLHRGGTITGSIRDASGAPVRDARVIALSPESTDGAEVVANAAGRFTIEHLRPGSYRVFARTGAGVAENVGVPVADGIETEIRVKLGARPALASR